MSNARSGPRHRGFLPLAAAALLFALAAPAAAESELPTLRAETSPVFSTDLSVIRDGEGRPSLLVNVSVPYSELQWVRTERGFAASVEITASLEARRGARSYGGSWQRQLLVPSYSATRSPNATLVERDTLKAPPSRYTLRVGLHDLQADRRSSASEPVVIEDWSRVPVGFSDLELGTVDTAGTFTPNLERRFGREASRLAGRAVLFDRRPGAWPRRYALAVRLKDESGTVLLSDDRVLTLPGTGAPMLLVPSRRDLFVGGYALEAELVEGRSHWRVSRSFEVEESGPPVGADFERMLEPLGYIAEDSEVEALRRLPPASRSEGWEEFWRRRDPTPETARNEALIDFVRRVRYADQHFQGFGAGWRSDMGKAYIRYGPPDQIETRPATAQTPQIEIWYYHQPYRRIVFVDREGFGRFVWVPSGIE